MGRPNFVWALLAGLLGCGPVAPGGEPGVGSSSSGGSPTTGAAVVTTGASSSGGTSGLPGETSADSSGGSAGSMSSEGFLRPVDLGESGTCNNFTQDCPPGMKCVPYADDGGGSWNNTKCVTVVDDPVQLDEPCFAPEGGVGGVDNCDFGLFCWDVDAEGNGFCVEMCSGSAEAGICNAPCTVCAAFAEGFLALCLKGCDPLKQDCDPSDVCIASPNNEDFLCVLDASGEEGQLHDPCMYANACDAGLFCSDPAAAVECDPEADGCCEPFCDISDPDADSTCPGVGQVCHPFFEMGMAPQCAENVGFCAVPM